MRYFKTLLTATLLAETLAGQTATLASRKAPADTALTANPDSEFWRGIGGIVIETDFSGNPAPGHRTEVRSRWTQENLYLLYSCKYDELNLKPNPSTEKETNQLWNWDVAEAFLGSDFQDIARYKEFQVSPQGEWVDLDIDRSRQKRGGGVTWNSGFEVKARIDAANKVWYGEMKIPFESIGVAAPVVGREIRAGLFRIAGAAPARKYISWQTTDGKTFHAPDRFAILRLAE
jgi:hypothetical protein